jgi:hypothetical protein
VRYNVGDELFPYNTMLGFTEMPGGERFGEIQCRGRGVSLQYNVGKEVFGPL